MIETVNQKQMEFVTLREGAKKRTINEGKGDIPVYQENTKVTFHFKTHILDENGLSNPSALDDTKSVGRPMELIFGKQFKMPVWEECFQTMKVDEVSEFEVKHNLVDAYPLVSKYYREYADIVKRKRAHNCGMMAFAEGVGHKDLDALLRNPKDLLFELEIVKVEQPGEYTKELWSMNPDEKLQSIPELKEKGNEFYRNQKFSDAATQYGQALGLLEQLLLREKPGDQEWLNLEKMKIPLLSNYAQCKLIQSDYYAVIDCTTRILIKDKNNVKALYRRAKAFTATWDLELARRDFKKVAELDPSFQEEVDKMMRKLSVLQKQKDAEIKSKLFGKIFGELN